MNITKKRLKQIIKEELDNFNEGKLTNAEKKLKNKPDNKLSPGEKKKKKAIQHK